MIAHSLAARAGVAASAIVALAWIVGGQAALGRIDPALALPLLPPPFLLLAWIARDAPAAIRRKVALLTLLLVAAAQAALGVWLAGAVPPAQIALVAASGAVAALLADCLMRARRSRSIRLLLSLLFVAGWFAGSHALLAALYRPAAAQGRPVTMLTGLPLRWSGEADMTDLLARGANEDPALARLDTAGPLRLVDSVVTDPPRPGGTLLLAHPRALAPGDLVAVDDFVRGGGRAVILADALSGWPSRHPLGDPRNPPVTSLLTPLLDHWGVTLGPAPAGEIRPLNLDVGAARLRMFSAGSFTRLPAGCTGFAGRRIATCRIGRGEAWLVGDADLLFAPLWQPAPRWAAHLRRADTMEWLAARLWREAPAAAMRPLWIRAGRSLAGVFTNFQGRDCRASGVCNRISMHFAPFLRQLGPDSPFCPNFPLFTLIYS